MSVCATLANEKKNHNQTKGKEKKRKHNMRHSLAFSVLLLLSIAQFLLLFVNCQATPLTFDDTDIFTLPLHPSNAAGIDKVVLYRLNPETRESRILITEYARYGDNTRNATMPCLRYRYRARYAPDVDRDSSSFAVGLLKKNDAVYTNLDAVNCDWYLEFTPAKLTQEQLSAVTTDATCSFRLLATKIDSQASLNDGLCNLQRDESTSASSSLSHSHFVSSSKMTSSIATIVVLLLTLGTFVLLTA